jgi:chaperonin GroES
MHGSHGMFRKMTPHEESIRAPMIPSREQPVYDGRNKAWRGVVTRDGWKYACFENMSWLLFKLNEGPYGQMNLAHNLPAGRSASVCWTASSSGRPFRVSGRSGRGFARLDNVPGSQVMNLRPLHDHVLVKRLDAQANKIGSLYIPDSAQEKPQEAEVVAVGAGKQLKDGRRVAMEVKVGDKILFGKYSGSETKVGGEEYLVLRESEILAVLGE